MKKSINENFKILNKTKEEMLFLSKSEIRLNILKCLKERSATVKEIVKITELTYSSVSSNVKKLENNKCIKKNENNKFEISHMTRIYLDSLLNFSNCLKFINRYEEFLNKHNINEISDNELENINSLINSELIKSTPIDIYKTHNSIKSFLLNSHDIKAVLPFLHPDYPKILENRLLEGGSLQLIVPDEIYKNLILKIDSNIRRKSLENGKLIVYKTRVTVEIYLTIGERRTSLGLFKNDNSFDQNRILTSIDEEAIKWSENLFSNIVNRLEA